MPKNFLQPDQNSDQKLVANRKNLVRLQLQITKQKSWAMTYAKTNYPWAISTLLTRTKQGLTAIRSDFGRYGKGFNHWGENRLYILAKGYIGNDLH